MPTGLIGKYIYGVMIKLYLAGEMNSVGKGEFVKYFNKAEPTNVTINDGMLSGYLNKGVRPTAEKLEKIESIDPKNIVGD